MWLRVFCARLQVSKAGGQGDVVRNGGGGLPIRLVSYNQHDMDMSRELDLLGAGFLRGFGLVRCRCWMIRELLFRSDAVNTGGVEECSGGQPAAASAQFALPGFGKPQGLVCWGLQIPG